MRIALERRLGIGHLHAPQQPDQARAMWILRRSVAGACQRMTSRSCVPTLEYRIERQIRVLRNEADAAAADAPVELRLGSTSRSSPSNQILPRIDRRALGRMPRMARTSVDLPQPDSPTTPRMRPGSSANSTSSSTRAMPSSVRIDSLRSAHVEQRHRGHRERLSRGSTMSRRPSPNRLKPSTVIRMARPGKVAYHQAPGR